MKAVYPSLSYALFTVIGIVAVSILMIYINSFAESIQNNYAHDQLNYVADIVRNNVLELYSFNAEGRMEVSIPRQIVGKQYSVEFDQKILRLSLDTGRRTIVVEKALNIDASFGGKSYAPVSIGIRKENNNVFIELI